MRERIWKGNYLCEEAGLSKEEKCVQGENSPRLLGVHGGLLAILLHSVMWFIPGLELLLDRL